MSREAKTGLFVLLTTAILFWASFYVGKFEIWFSQGRTYEAMLDTAHALGVDSPVEIAGIEVGRIIDMQIVRGGQKALVRFRIRDEDVEIYRDASISVYSSGFLGDRYISLNPGTPETGKLPEGEPIADTYVPIPLEEMMAKMTPLINEAVSLVSNLREVVTSEEIQRGIPETIDSMRHTALSLELVLSDYEKYISRFIRNISRGSEALSDDLPELIDEWKGRFKKTGDSVGGYASMVSETMQRLDRIARLVEDTAVQLNQVVATVERGEGTVGTLVKDEDTANDVREAVDSLNQTLAAVTKLQTEFSYLGTYASDFGGDDGFRNRFEVAFRPSYDHYYGVGIVDRSEKVESTRTEEIVTTDDVGNVTTVTRTIRERKSDLLFNAYIAKRFWDLTLRGGVIENDGGIGLDYALFDDRLWLRAEAFDFNRRDDRPRVRSWAELRLFNHLTIAAGAEDLAGRSGPQARFGLGIVFNDQDLKYLFGSLPIKF
ncbi:MAG: MCE family protein [Candidatus Dadabacteria bacterium]|nr:MAG: MCE family protein [Candidatus Dadabacteria bacterium]